MAMEPADHSATGDFEAHVRDYSGFVKMFKYGAIASFAIGLIVMMLIS